DVAPCRRHRQEGAPLERFRPSIDWGNELAASALWIFNAWALSAVCVLLVAVLVIRYSTFGRRAWRITGGYFTGTASVVVWGTLSVLLLRVIVDRNLEVLRSQYNNDQSAPLQVLF